MAASVASLPNVSLRRRIVRIGIVGIVGILRMTHPFGTIAPFVILDLFGQVLDLDAIHRDYLAELPQLNADPTSLRFRDISER
jgi:hypothetical protein